MALFNNDNLLNAIFCQSRLKILPNSKYTLKKCQIFDYIVKVAKDLAKSGRSGCECVAGKGIKICD